MDDEADEEVVVVADSIDNAADEKVHVVADLITKTKKKRCAPICHALKFPPFFLALKKWLNKLREEIVSLT